MAAKVNYRVEFLYAKDYDGLPITVDILVDKEDDRFFRDYLLNELGNTIGHIEDENGNEYEA